MKSPINSPPSAPAKLLTARDAARLFGISERFLWSLTNPRGPIPVVRIGRAVKYAVSDLEAFIREQTTSADSNPQA